MVNFIKIIFTDHRGYVASIFFLTIPLSFYIAINHHKFWNIWGVITLAITLVYGIYYYIDFSILVFSRIHILTQENRKLYLVVAIAILAPIILGLIGFFLYVPNSMWNDRLPHYGLLAVSSIFFFLVLDTVVGKIINNAKSDFENQLKSLKEFDSIISPEFLASNCSFWTKSTVIEMAKKGVIPGGKYDGSKWSFDKNEVASYFENECIKPLNGEAYLNIVKYVDIPTFIAVLTVEFFKVFSQFKIELEPFYFGATTFQLIAFNIVFSIFLITSILNESGNKIIAPIEELKR
jgi:hypothetical protein